MLIDQRLLDKHLDSCFFLPETNSPSSPFEMLLWRVTTRKMALFPPLLLSSPTYINTKKEGCSSSCTYSQLGSVLGNSSELELGKGAPSWQTKHLATIAASERLRLAAFLGWLHQPVVWCEHHITRGEGQLTLFPWRKGDVLDDLSVWDSSPIAA